MLRCPGADGSTSKADDDYNPPTHWAVAQPSSSATRKRQESDSAVQGLVKQSYYRTNYGKAAEAAPGNAVNFPSSFKATTPVYPKNLDIDLSQDVGAGEEPVKFPSKFHGKQAGASKNLRNQWFTGFFL